MKLTKSQLREMIREEIKSLNEESGEYFSFMDLSVIIASIEKSKLLNSSDIALLKSRKRDAVIKIIMNNMDTLYKSLKKNGRDYLNSAHYTQILNKFERLISGKSKFIDY